VSWLLRALFRAFHFKEVELPENWDVQVNRIVITKKEENDSRIRGQLLPFKVTVRLLESPEKWESTAKLGSFLPVKLEMVDPSEAIVTCRAVGPASDDYNYKGPIKIQPRASASALKQDEK
jgi:hypothetical protein